MSENSSKAIQLQQTAIHLTPDQIMQATIDLTRRVDEIQKRQRLRLVDSDDIGEFVQECAKLSAYGINWVRFVGACPDSCANSYKGACKSTVLLFRLNNGQPEFTALREQRFSKHRFQVLDPGGAPLTTLGYRQASGYWLKVGRPCPIGLGCRWYTSYLFSLTLFTLISCAHIIKESGVTDNKRRGD